MKKIVLIFSFVLISLITLSCDFGSSGGSHNSYISVTYVDGVKSLSKGLNTKIRVKGSVADNSVFEEINSKLKDKYITGLSFVGISEISGQFSSSTDTSITDLEFDAALVKITNSAFLTSKNLECVRFSGKCNEIHANAFPAGCSFTVEVPLKEIEFFKTFFSDFNVDVVTIVSVEFDSNSTEYRKITPSFSCKKVLLKTKQQIKNVEIPKSSGWIFTGYYADSDTTATQIFDSNGAVTSETNAYTSGGNWIREENTVLYAHWDKEPGWVYPSTDIIVDYQTGNPFVSPNLFSCEFLKDAISPTKSIVDNVKCPSGCTISGFYLDDKFTTKILDCRGFIAVDNLEGYVKNRKWVYAGNNPTVKLYASFTNLTGLLEVRIDKNGGTKDGSFSVVLGTGEVKNYIKPLHDSREFDFCSTVPDVSGHDYGDIYLLGKNETVVRSGTAYTDVNGVWKGPSEDVVVYAIWTGSLNPSPHS